MKKYLLSSLLASMVVHASAGASSCLDFSTNLSRGAESSLVLSVQNFLVAKGLLKATPNGYFGPGTLAAVKAYQKSLGLAQVGNTGPATRAAIKKASCAATSAILMPQLVATPTSTVVASSTVAVTTTPTQAHPFVPRPTIDSFDLVTLFAGGETDWTFTMYGNNFSTTTNSINLRDMSNGRVYAIGTLPSASGTIIMPKNLTGVEYFCGVNCREKLPAGTYEVTVLTEGGESNGKTLTIKSFTSSVVTGTVQVALSANAVNAKLGGLAFSAAAPVVVDSIVLNFISNNISQNAFKNIVLKNEITGEALLTAGAGMGLGEFQTSLIGAYVDTDNLYAGTVTANFTVEIEDYIGKKKSRFVSPSFTASVLGNGY